MTDPAKPAHSPLGASSAERWMNCPGSVALIKQLAIPEETTEPDYRVEGTRAHALLEWCLRGGCDAWEAADLTINGEKPTVEMMDAVQVFLDTVRVEPGHIHRWIEEHIDNPEFHPQFYGTVDYGILYPGVLEVNDFKYGMGIVVEVTGNPQIMYYAYGILAQIPVEDRPEKVRMRIIQPRAFHPDGVVREWTVDADVIIGWAEHTLKPAMVRASEGGSLMPGEHCRFCPAKLACAALVGMFEAAIGADPKRVVDITDAGLDAQYPMIPAVKSYIKALEEETYNRNLHGHVLAHSKLVYKKANRVWKPGARDILAQNLTPEELLTAPELRSPAEIEKLGGLAKKLVHEYAYTPESGLTVAPTSDKRVAVKVPSSAETFKTFLQRAEKPE